MPISLFEIRTACLAFVRAVAQQDDAGLGGGGGGEGGQAGEVREGRHEGRGERRDG